VALTYKWWEREGDTLASTSSLPLTTADVTALQPTYNAAGTLLRSRWFPSVTYEEGNSALHNQAALQKLQVQFVAWYEPDIAGFGPPLPTDQDTRIIATAVLKPQYFPSQIGPTSTYYIKWMADPVLVESFAQRKPDIATYNNPYVHGGLWVNDPSAYYYSSHTNLGWTMQCLGEALFGI
jgi:hypothetical protein